MQTDVVDAEQLERVGVAVEPDAVRGMELPRLGPSVIGNEIRIVDQQSRHVLGERRVGEIQIRGKSVVRGYYRSETQPFTDDGWLCTGDSGYITGGELVVTGRQDDMIIVGGRNIPPTAIETEVNELPGIRAGCVVAFGVGDEIRGTQSVVVVAEVRDLKRAVRAKIAGKVVAQVGVNVSDMVLRARGQLPKTSSGKLRRHYCKKLYEQGRLEPLA